MFSWNLYALCGNSDLFQYVPLTVSVYMQVCTCMLCLSSLDLTVLIRRSSIIQDAPCLPYINNVTLWHQSATEQNNLQSLHSSPCCHQHSLSHEKYFRMDLPSPERRWQLIVLHISMSGELFLYSAENEDKLFLCFTWRVGNKFIFFSPLFIWKHVHFLCFSAHGQLDCMFSVYLNWCSVMM